MLFFPRSPVFRWRWSGTSFVCRVGDDSPHLTRPRSFWLRWLVSSCRAPVAGMLTVLFGGFSHSDRSPESMSSSSVVLFAARPIPPSSSPSMSLSSSSVSSKKRCAITWFPRPSARCSFLDRELDVLDGVAGQELSCMAFAWSRIAWVSFTVDCLRLGEGAGAAAAAGACSLFGGAAEAVALVSAEEVAAVDCFASSFSDDFVSARRGI